MVCADWRLRVCVCVRACVQGVEPRRVGKPGSWSHVTTGRAVLTEVPRPVLGVTRPRPAVRSAPVLPSVL